MDAEEFQAGVDVFIDDATVNEAFDLEAKAHWAAIVQGSVPGDSSKPSAPD